MRLAAATLACALCAALPAAAQEPQPAPQPQPEPTIAQGVTAGGVDLSGLTASQAEAKLVSVLTPHLQRDLVLGAAGVPFRLTMAQAKLVFDAAATAQQALQTTPPPPPSGGGAAPGAVVPLALGHSRAAVRAFVNSVAERAYRRPRDARLRITVRHMRITPSKRGARVNRKAVRKQVDTALDDGGASRILHVRLQKVRPRIGTKRLRSLHSTVVTIDRAHFRLRLFKRLRIAKRYGIAVGMAGLETPPGHYRIQDKQVDPAWHVPNSAWAGSLAGQTIPGGAPDNPLKARWLGVANGVGIHGTAEDWSIGTRASHGCIRMHVSDVIDLYPRVPVGTEVLIK